MPETRSAAPVVPPPLPGRARTPIPTAAPPAVAPLAPVPEALPLLVPVAASAPAQPPPRLVPVGAAPAAASTSVAVAPTLPSADEAEAILAAALRGEPDPDPAWRSAAERVVRALSADERTALSAGPLSLDPLLLRSAAGLRLRLEAAVALVLARLDLHATVFPALLGEVDATLLKVKLAGADAPAAAEALEPVRLALVDGGVALAGAMARTGPAAPVAAVPTASSRPAARVLSNVTAAEAAKVERGGKGLWVVFALTLAVAGAYHGYEFATRKPPAALPTVPGAPAHTFVIRQGASVVLNLEPGAQLDPAELDRFKLQERAKGNEVQALGPGMWTIERAPAEGSKP
jgi:hypothetical protein